MLEHLYENMFLLATTNLASSIGFYLDAFNTYLLFVQRMKKSRERLRRGVMARATWHVSWAMEALPGTDPTPLNAKEPLQLGYPKCSH